MKIVSLRNVASSKSLIRLEDNPRNSFVCLFENVLLTGRNIHYPNCLLLENNTALISPYDEKVMSLKKESFYDGNTWALDPILHESVVDTPCFFFHYNVDNYYHFVYDTLPILYFYFKLKQTYPTLQLLIQTSHPISKQLPFFVTDFLSSLAINSIKFGNETTLYTKLFVASSLTHGGFSNESPSPYASIIWNSMKSSVSQVFPKRIYVSRRSWIHGKTENMGTNYTLRRKCVNEDALVDLLRKYNIEEVFTELLTTDEKIKLFSEAELVVGIIGGGMCNLLLAPSQTNSLCIATPNFLEINQRFKHSMDHTKIVYSHSASLEPFEGNYSLYTRVRIKDTGLIGEVEGYKEKKVLVKVSNNDIAGFSQNFPLETKLFDEDCLEALDNGLNSPFIIDLSQLEKDLNTLSTRE
jgi:hypothetical protein